MSTISREIVDAILSKDNVNANEKIYDALYGKSSEELQSRKVQIAKHFFSTDDSESEETEIEDNTDAETQEEPTEQ